ncbi:MAG: hypothetical protein D6712_12285 [Chloroflexi bacterium]|nr:MAG: hypothetical protein D6712_12285 [Chloroflexota bacterium]
MDDIAVAIIKTLLYADVFNFPMTAEEIHHFLVHDSTVPYITVLKKLQHETLQPYIEEQDGYFMLRGRKELVAIRQQRQQASQELWHKAIHWGRWLSRLPFVRMVAITGALAMKNASSLDDDLDYLIITAEGRVWLARAAAIVIVRIGRLFGVEICPNYVLAQNHLAQEKQDLFIAHEVTQMIPVYGHALYYQIRQANEWTQSFLPNAQQVFFPVEEYRPNWLWRLGKRIIEFSLSGWAGNLLERWERQRKTKRFQPKAQQPQSSAKLDETMVKGHFEDYGHPTLRRYFERLQAYQLESSIASGD